MKLIRTELENVCQFAHLEHIWDPGLNGVLGPNGAGKSNILKAINFSVTGTFANAGTKAENVFQLAPEKSRSRVIQELEHQGTHIEIVRVLRKGTSHCRIGGGEQIDGDTNVTQAVLDVLGIDPRVMAEYIFVPQRKVAGFIDETPGERARTFQQLFGTDGAAVAYRLLGDEIKRVNPQPRSPEIDPLRERLAADRRARDELVAGLAADRSALVAIPVGTARVVVERAERASRDQEDLARQQAELAQAEVAARQAARVVASAHAELVELQAARDEAKADATRSRDALARWKAYEARMVRRRRLADRRAELDAEPARHIEPLPQAGYPGEDMVQRRINEATQRVGIMEAFLVKFRHRPDVCPTCGSKTDALKQTADTYEAELPGWKQRLRAAQDLMANQVTYQRQYAAWGQWQRDYQRRSAQLAQDEAAEQAEDAHPDLKKEVAEEVVVAYANLEEALGGAGLAVSEAQADYASAQARATALRGQVQAHNLRADQMPSAAQVAEARRQLAAVEDLKVMIADREGELRALQRILAANETLLGRLEAAEAKAETDRLWVYHLGQVQELLHPRRLPQMVAENYLEVLADDTNDILEESDAGFRVRLGEGLGFVAEFILGPYAGTVSPAQRLSEGQKVILALPFRVAVNSLFAGAVGLLCLDEPTESLDAQNIAALEIAVSRLRDLSESRGLQVLLVTHEPSLDRLFDGVLRL